MSAVTTKDSRNLVHKLGVKVIAEVDSKISCFFLLKKKAVVCGDQPLREGKMTLVMGTLQEKSNGVTVMVTRAKQVNLLQLQVLISNSLLLQLLQKK